MDCDVISVPDVPSSNGGLVPVQESRCSTILMFTLIEGSARKKTAKDQAIHPQLCPSQEKVLFVTAKVCDSTVGILRHVLGKVYGSKQAIVLTSAPVSAKMPGLGFAGSLHDQGCRGVNVIIKHISTCSSMSSINRVLASTSETSSEGWEKTARQFVSFAHVCTQDHLKCVIS